MGNPLPTMLIAFTGPMLFTYMSVWIIVGLTAKETTRISNAHEGQNQLHESQAQACYYGTSPLWLPHI